MLARRLLIVLSLLFTIGRVVASDYQELSWDQKRDYLWENTLDKAYEDEELPALSTIPGFQKLLALTNLFISFNRQSDELPYYRKKVVHSFGSVGKVSFRPLQEGQALGYTGIFKGAEGLARLSLAADPKINGFTPGMAIKFLISKHPSVNIHVMNSVNGQGEDTNFFSRDFSNEIPRAKGYALKLLEFWFSVFVKPANKLGLTHLAVYKQDGEEEVLRNSPKKIVLRPTVEAGSYFLESEHDLDFRIKLASIPKGTVLYDVYNENGIKFGQITLDSSFVASKYGDEKLFFQHKKFD